LRADCLYLFTLLLRALGEFGSAWPAMLWFVNELLAMEIKLFIGREHKLRFTIDAL
jgi:hypothetical protein